MHTSPKERPLSPVHSKHAPRPKTHTLSKVNTPPEIHSQYATTEIQTAKIKDRGITDICQTAEMLVLEGLVDCFVEVAVVNLIGPHARERGGDFGELMAEILALLVGALSGGGEGGKFGVDLVKEFGKFAEVEGAGLVLVVLLEELVKAAEVVGGLREALLDAVGYIAPFSEGEV